MTTQAPSGWQQRLPVQLLGPHTGALGGASYASLPASTAASGADASTAGCVASRSPASTEPPSSNRSLLPPHPAMLTMPQSVTTPASATPPRLTQPTMPQTTTRARPPSGEPPAFPSTSTSAHIGQVPTHVFQATQFGSAVHAVWIWVWQPPASVAACAGPLRHVRHAWVGAVCVAAQMLERHSLPHGPGAAVVPQPHVRSAVTNVS